MVTIVPSQDYMLWLRAQDEESAIRAIANLAMNELGRVSGYIDKWGSYMIQEPHIYFNLSYAEANHADIEVLGVGHVIAHWGDDKIEMTIRR